MEDYIEFRDYLCFGRDKDIKSIINEEQLLFSDNANKIVALGLYKERNILVSNKAFYNLNNKSKFKYNLYIIKYI